jgi:hypothetical protein
MAYPSSPGWKSRGPSRDAARNITGHARTVRDRVQDFLKNRYPAAYSADEIADHLGESILTVRPRVSELSRSGEIEAATELRKNASGMNAHCWRAKGGLSKATMVGSPATGEAANAINEEKKNAGSAK